MAVVPPAARFPSVAEPGELRVARAVQDALLSAISAGFANEDCISRLTSSRAVTWEAVRPLPERSSVDFVECCESVRERNFSDR